MATLNPISAQNHLSLICDDNPVTSTLRSNQRQQPTSGTVARASILPIRPTSAKRLIRRFVNRLLRCSLSTFLARYGWLDNFGCLKTNTASKCPLTWSLLRRLTFPAHVANIQDVWQMVLHCYLHALHS